MLAPDIAAVDEIVKRLTFQGAKLGSDGRPIVGMSSKHVLELILEVSDECMLIPAHVWTPYFGLFGSMSGYDSVEECFEDLSPHIYALETGLSADPEMFWQISQFDRFTLVSCSDPHSLPRIGRECNALDLDPADISYCELTRIIKERDSKKFLYTLEYYPAEGRYHYDGHRDCKVSLHPNETAKLKGICPVCGKKLTIGVLSRIEQLADRPEGFRPEGFRSESFLPEKNANGVLGGKPVIGQKHFVVLEEIIAAAMHKGVSTKAVQSEYVRLTDNATEFSILLQMDIPSLRKITSQTVAQAIQKVRDGNLEIIPGFDGEYGKILLFDSTGSSPLAETPQTLF